MSQNACPKCGKGFKYPSKLREHLARKTPCAPIVDREQLSKDDLEKPYCRYCGRTFTTDQAASRHMRHRCKIANSEDGMEKLLDHTLQKQVAALAAQNMTLQKRVEQLTEMMERQMSLGPTATGGPYYPVIGTLNTGPVTNVTNNIQTSVQVNIVTFDREDRLRIPVSLVKAAFTENPLLINYCRLDDDTRTNAEKAAPYVLEALVDLVRRAHRDPVYRNVYLNPKRADQVMVYVAKGTPGVEEDGASGAEGGARSSKDECKQCWEVRPLVDAIRLLFDGVANDLHKIVITDQERRQLPLDIQSAASWVPNLYEDAPGKFVNDGRAPMSAHLENTRPVPGPSPFGTEGFARSPGEPLEARP